MAPLAGYPQGTTLQTLADDFTDRCPAVIVKLTAFETKDLRQQYPLAGADPLAFVCLCLAGPRILMRVIEPRTHVDAGTINAALAVIPFPQRDFHIRSGNPAEIPGNVLLYKSL